MIYIPCMRIHHNKRKSRIDFLIAVNLPSSMQTSANLQLQEDDLITRSTLRHTLYY